MKRFEPSLPELRALVEERAASFLAQHTRALPESAELVAEITRVVSAGGKRLRPAFCYWGYRAAGAAHGPDIVSIAVAFELLHTFALVHDDVMDAATERRGQPSTVAQLGVPGAILVGDLALVLADAAFWSSGFEPDILAEAFVAFTAMREEVIAGQSLDVTVDAADVDEDMARRIARLKSGSYSVEHPVTIGALLGGGSDRLREQLGRFGRALGEAFQLRDDVLGVLGDPAQTGKPADADIREGKRNILFVKTLAALGGAERRFFGEAWGGGEELSAGDVARLRTLVEVSGAAAAVDVLIDELTEEALSELAAAGFDPQSYAALEALSHSAVRRVT